MTATTEETVLMKCKKCNYEEAVPKWILGELCEFDPNPSKQWAILCPKCEKNTFVIKED